MITASSRAPTRIAGGPPGEQVLPAGARRTPVDDRDLERQPHDVRALERPADQERRERRRERQDPRAERGDRGREQQHLLVADQVAEPGERRHDERGDDQLRGLEPVDVGVGDVEVVGDVAEDRRVVALQDAAGELDADQEADDRDEAVDRLGRLRAVGGRGSSRGSSRSGAGTSARRRRRRRPRGARRRSGSPRAAPWSSGTARTGRPGRRSR